MHWDGGVMLITRKKHLSEERWKEKGRAVLLATPQINGGLERINIEVPERLAPRIFASVTNEV